ncbi:MAG: MucB/RseB C-terminal domain-containing protein [Deferribacteraceae bacterium]|jgi:hypothetical protein|nr:MucB/RseB C-terminal domain-containing protein [Deferribacteraceae bacterium]
MRVVALLILLIIPTIGLSDEIIYYNINHNGESLSFFNMLGAPVPPMVQEISRRTLRKPFMPKRIDPNRYKVSIVQNITWQGMTVTQYDYKPVINDRFRHILWVLPDTNEIVKLEIYDANDKLIYCAICLEHDHSLQTNKTKEQPEERLTAERFDGFVNVSKEEAADGYIRMLYSDGLNRFSVFRTPLKEAKKEAERLVVYGNYLYNKDVGNFRYTVVGTIPYEKMEEFVNVLSVVNVDKNSGDIE